MQLGFAHSPIKLSFFTLLTMMAWTSWSCNSIKYTHTFTSTNSAACEADPSYIYPFLEGEPIKFSYSKIGKVEVVSKSSKYNNEMLIQLMKVSSSKCANAIIGIYTDRVVQKNKYGLPFTRPRIIGIAVRILEDSTFTANYKKYKKDLKNIRTDDPNFARKIERQKWIYALGATFSITIIVILGILAING